MEVQESKPKKEQNIKGLHAMRAGRTSGTPDFFCENCKCKRFSECGCIKSKEYKEKHK